MKLLSRTILIAVVVAFILGLSIPVPAAEAEKININTASAEELTQLKRIGPKYAQKIIEFREKNGPFQTVEDIMKVPGIGKKTLEENKDRITVE